LENEILELVSKSYGKVTQRFRREIVMPDYLIIADDLSGACDTAVQFRKFGFRTLVLNKQNTETSLIDRFDAVAVTTNSRDLQAKEAKQCVKEICPYIKRLAPGHIYKKIDSILSTK